MAPSNSLIMILPCSLFFFALARKEFVHKTNEEAQHYHTFQLSSFLPSSSCIPFAKGDKKTGFLEVVHKHGPCSKFSEDMVKPLTVEEIFTHDQSRVDSIRAKLAISKGKTDTLGSKATLPAKSGSAIRTDDYIVTIGLGTPTKDLTVIFDTGTGLTWTQCQPCAQSCYNQKEPIFAPSASATYSNSSCPSTECAGFDYATGYSTYCSSTTCGYKVRYVDQSFSFGFLGKEKLTLTAKDIVNDFYFGCGQNNDGVLFGGAAGVLGLGRDKLSIVSQTATKYGKVFSYCLPSSSSATGYLTFGSSGISSNVKYTPISTSQGRSFYGLELEAIYVAGTKLAISPTVFSSGMIIDSGAVITRLPPTAYLALSKAFREQMTNYTLTKALRLLDTCYDFTNTPTVTIPKISMLWDGNTLVEIPPSGILYGHDKSQMCLAYASNGDHSDSHGIFGNTQQKTLQVVYDVNAGKVGFAPGGCA